MDEQQLFKEIEWGAKAKAVLETEAFKAAISTVQQGIFDGFASTDPKDAHQLLVQRLKLQCLAEVVRSLSTVMDTGMLASQQIETLREKAKRKFTDWRK